MNKYSMDAIGPQRIFSLPLKDRTSNRANMDLPILSKWKRLGLCQTRGTKIPGLGHPFLGSSTFIFVINTAALKKRNIFHTIA